MTPNELVLTFGGLHVCVQFGENRRRNATVRVSTDGHTHTRTHGQTQNDFIICPMLYSIAMGQIKISQNFYVLRLQPAIITDCQKFTIRLSLYEMSSFHFYCSNQYKIIPLRCMLRTRNLHTEIFGNVQCPILGDPKPKYAAFAWLTDMEQNGPGLETVNK